MNSLKVRFLVACFVLLVVVPALLNSQHQHGKDGPTWAARAEAKPQAGLFGPSGLPFGATIVTLDAKNRLFIFNGSRFIPVNGGNGFDGQLIGIDFRPADRNLYALSDQGSLYRIGQAGATSRLSPRFAGGVQSLMDFNPVVDAIRLIGSNDQNFALVSQGGLFNVTAPQTAITYDPADVNAGRDPNLCGGAYTNNVAGAANTIFYAIDYDLDVLVTISSKNATGSSNTGGGKLRTIGQIVNGNGQAVNFTSIADLDVYTDAQGNNTLVGVSSQLLFVADLGQIDPNLPFGRRQPVVARFVLLNDGGFIDLAIAPFRR